MIEVVSPFDGKVVGRVKKSSLEDVQNALHVASELFNDRSKWLPRYKRVEILENAMHIISSRVEELTILCASEGGKPYMDSKVEVLRAISGIKVAIESLSVYEGKEVAMGHTLSSANKIAYTFKEPIGVVGAICAFNHPFNLAIHQIIPAVAVGCPVIIKPATKTPLSALKLVEILEEAGLPSGWAQVVVCDKNSANALASSPKISYLSFIGSAEVGWLLSKSVANGTRVALEHGGVAPVIVHNDVSVDEVVPLLGKGAFYHAGQVCVSVQRVFVHVDVVGELTQKLTQSAKALVVGDPLDPKTQVGPMINEDEIKRVQNWVDEALSEGAELLCGGTSQGSCYSPTVLLNPSQTSQVSTKELFAPVVCLYEYSDINEAIKIANSLEVSFQAAVFSKDIDIALKCVKELNATAVMVNEHSAFRVDWMPFGGAKSSGIGIGGIPYSMDEMSNTKLMVINSPVL